MSSTSRLAQHIQAWIKNRTVVDQSTIQSFFKLTSPKIQEGNSAALNNQPNNKNPTQRPPPRDQIFLASDRESFSLCVCFMCVFKLPVTSMVSAASSACSCLRFLCYSCCTQEFFLPFNSLTDREIETSPRPGHSISGTPVSGKPVMPALWRYKQEDQKFKSSSATY